MKKNTPLLPPQAKRLTGHLADVWWKFQNLNVDEESNVLYV